MTRCSTNHLILYLYDQKKSPLILDPSFGRSRDLRKVFCKHVFVANKKALKVQQKKSKNNFLFLILSSFAGPQESQPVRLLLDK